MKALAELGAPQARALRGVLFDLDDTLLSHGSLTRQAYGALWDLHDAGLRLVAVTGRPSGWGDVLVRQWPIDGAVTENGPIAFARGSRGEALLHDACTEAERKRRRALLDEIVGRVATLVPEATLTDDVRARRSDVTWDIAERTRLAPERIRLIVGEILRSGARTTQSSVHLHATYDVDDKASGAMAFLRGEFREDAGAARHRYAFIGDSANDAACFAAFATTFGVANVRAQLGGIRIPPVFCATRPMGAGFAEVAAAILSARSPTSST